MPRGRVSLRRVWRSYREFLRYLPGVPLPSVEARIAQVIARRGIVSREELREIAREAGASHTTVRVVIHILGSCDLIYTRKHCKKCYVASIPWILYVHEVLGDKWVEWLQRKAPGISKREVEDLKKLIELARADGEEPTKLSDEERKLSERLKIIRRFVQTRLETLRYMSKLVNTIHELIPKECSSPPSRTILDLIYGLPGSKPLDKAKLRQLASAIVSELDKHFLECYAIPVLEYIPFLLKLLAGLAYTYATGYDLKRYIAELRFMTKRIKELICPSESCYELHEKLVTETLNRLVALLEHLHQVTAVENLLQAIANSCEAEWERKGVAGQELYHYRSITKVFLTETLAEFYTWMLYIEQELTV